MKRFLVLLALMHWMKTTSSKIRCLNSAKADALINGWLLGSTSHHLGYAFSDYSNRSISPWQYRVYYDKDRFPSILHFAECKFAGCIIDGLEDNSFNSVQVFQTQMVLKRKRCPNSIIPGRYYFEVGFMHVPVACTCVVPRQ